MVKITARQSITMPNFRPHRRKLVKLYDPAKQHQYYLTWKKKHYKEYLAKLKRKRAKV